jgi:hypothetical protein
MYPLLNRRSKLDNRNKGTKIYQAIIRPTMTYGSPSWRKTLQKNIRRLQTVQNITIRQILKAPWYHTNEQLHNDIKFPTIEEHIRKLTENTEEKIKTPQPTDKKNNGIEEEMKKEKKQENNEKRQKKGRNQSIKQKGI